MMKSKEISTRIIGDKIDTNVRHEGDHTRESVRTESRTTSSSLATGSRRSDDTASSGPFEEDGASSMSRGTSEIGKRLTCRARREDNINVKNLTINKLRFEIGMFGREREIEDLISSLVHMTSKPDEKRKELIFIKGYSGVGKSKLAYTLEKFVTEMENGIFATGKFDLNKRDAPYAGIAAAFGDIYQKIKNEYSCYKESKDVPLSEIGEATLSELGSEIELLLQLIPQLGDILPPTRSQRSNPEIESPNFEAGPDRWKYVFRVLTRILSSYFSPMVLFFDNLQWADLASLNLIDSLISDSQNSNSLMIVGTFRSNEVDKTHVLSTVISDLEQRKEKVGFTMTHIELQGLKVGEVNEVIMAMLSIDEESRTKGLAEICFRRTLGNPFFLIQFMTLLEETGLIMFSLGLLQWKWDEKDIEKETMSAENVVDLLQDRMRKLPKEDQLLLEYAACLGSSFRVSMLELVWRKHSAGRKYAVKNGSEGEAQTLTKSLTELEDGNFLEKTMINSYRWVHDKVQEAALSLRDAGIDEFQFDVGSVLYQSLNDNELEDSLFDVVDLINKGNKHDHPEFSALNLRAAEKACNISAFHSATAYVSNGIKLLPPDKWTSHRNLTLHLYTIGADTELALGRVEAMEVYIDEVLSRKDFSTLDKLPLYLIKFRKLCGVDRKYNDTEILCLSLLEELGHSMTWNRYTLPHKAKLSLSRTVRRARKISKDFYEAPKKMTDPRHQAIMNLLSRIKNTAYLGRNKFLLILSTTRMVNMTIDHGSHPFSGDAYSCLGILSVALLGNFEAASHLAETALLIQKAISSRYTESSTLFTLNFAVLPWTNPVPTCLKQLYQGYTLGMQSGNTDIAMWNLLMHSTVLPYHMGKSLPSIEEDALQTIAQMEELKQTNQALYTKMWCQGVLNLIGKSNETVLLKGDIFDSEAFASQNPAHRLYLGMITSELLIFFGDFERAAEMALARGRSFAMLFPGHIICMMETFHRGLALYAMARKTKKRKYKKPAQQIRKMIKTWIQRGNPNVKQYYLLLSAEHAALRKEYKPANVLYQKAIVLAGRTGHLHNAALFNERYADFLREELSDNEEALYRIEEAIRFYRHWGAVRKVETLLERTFTC
jgi:predicted ATPase